MISNQESKFIRSLHQKKYRQLEQKFLAEGTKNVLELLHSSLNVESVFATQEFINEFMTNHNSIDTREVSTKELQKVGTLKTNNSTIAIAHIPDPIQLPINQDSILAFDRIRDPGNLGTIIRIADWYGFQHIVCSPDSVDCYNPKVVSATMGSFARVNVHYQDLETLCENTTHIYGTTLEGDNIHEMQFESPSLIIFGNESSGIGEEIKDKLSRQILIPGYGQAESLNVAVSTAIFCDNFRRLLQS